MENQLQKAMKAKTTKFVCKAKKLLTSLNNSYIKKKKTVIEFSQFRNENLI